MGWWDVLSDISDAGLGIAKGLDAGMAPLKTWEGIRTVDLKNDEQEIGNRNIELQQQYREGLGVPAFYEDWGQSEVTGLRKKTAGNELDAYSNQEKQALMQRMSQADAAFRADAQARGLKPGSVEYAQLASEHLGNASGFGAIEAYDKMNIPGMQNRNMNQQTAIVNAQAVLQKKYPGATLTRNNDGTFTARSPSGEEVPLTEGQVLLLASDMINAKTPGEAVRTGIKQELDIQAGNVKMIDAITKGKITPKEQFAEINKVVLTAQEQLKQFDARVKADPAVAAAIATKDPDQIKAALAPFTAERAERVKQLNQFTSLQRNFMMRNFGGQQPPVTPTPRVQPSGNASQTTRPGAAAAAASGTNATRPINPVARNDPTIWGDMHEPSGGAQPQQSGSSYHPFGMGLLPDFNMDAGPFGMGWPSWMKGGSKTAPTQGDFQSPGRGLPDLGWTPEQIAFLESMGVPIG